MYFLTFIMQFTFLMTNFWMGLLFWVLTMKKSLKYLQYNHQPFMALIIPIGMKMYPGNESEKPVLRDIIDGLKTKNNIVGKTIHVADKGLNCAQNIAFSKQNGMILAKLESM